MAAQYYHHLFLVGFPSRSLKPHPLDVDSPAGVKYCIFMTSLPTQAVTQARTDADPCVKKN